MVEFHNDDKIGRMLNKMLKDYNLYHHEDLSELEDEEKIQLKRAADTALDMFRSLFCDKEEFESGDAASEFLADHEDDIDTALATFRGWCKELVSNNTYELIEADTLRELQERVQTFTASSTQYEEPLIWSLVKQIRLGFDIPILQYVKFIDSPGVDDTNELRANAPLDQVQQCDEIWIATKIARATTDRLVETMLAQFGARIKVAIICTATDESVFDNDLAKELKTFGQEIFNHDELRDRENELHKKITSASSKVKSRETALSKGFVMRNKKQMPFTEKKKELLREEASEFEAERRQAQNEYDKIRQERFELIVNARNAFAYEELQKAKPHALEETGAELQVFFVCNPHYSYYKGGPEVDGPKLAPEATGIPAIRSYIHESAATNRVEALEDFISHPLPILMNGLGLLAGGTSLNGCEEALNLVKLKQAELKPGLDSHIKNISELAEKHVVGELREQQQSHIDTALEVLDKKKKWRYGTIKAFIFHNGKHATAKMQRHSWNAQFKQDASEEIGQLWDDFTTTMDVTLNGTERMGVDLINQITEKVGTSSVGMMIPIERFRQAMDGFLSGTKQLFRDFAVQSRLKSRNIELMVTLDDPEAYFSEAMQQAFDQCKTIFGPGSKGKVLEIMRNHLSSTDDRSPFAIMANKIERAVQADAQKQVTKLQKDMQKKFTEIEQMLQDMFHEDTDDPVDQELLEELHKNSVKAEEKFQGYKRSYESLKQTYDISKSLVVSKTETEAFKK